MSRRSVVLALAAMLALSVPSAAVAKDPPGRADKLSKIDHIVVIYQENHSFDNLYGGWEGVNGLGQADAAQARQVDQSGGTFTCLKQTDVNLAAVPAAADCTTGQQSAGPFPNGPFTIDGYIPASATTCPPPGVFAPNGVLDGAGRPGGCTEDLVHRFYQEQYQLDGGRQDRYVAGSDAVGLTMGTYDTTQLPIYRYLHTDGHPGYAIADDFFQAAFGGSFLNHQWLVAAQTPTFANAVQDGSSIDLHSAIDLNGMPASYPLYKATGTVKDSRLTVKCPAGGQAASPVLCGDYAINTIQPTYQPFSPGTAAAQKLPPLTTPNIGDELSAAGVTWAWYSGGWSNANGDVGGPGWTNGNGPACSDPGAFATATYPNCPDKLFQFHHQPLNYFAAYAPGTQARKDHLRDEQEFLSLATGSRKECRLPSVSFVKPIGEDNEHPGYASEPDGSDHLVDLLKAVEDGACARDTMVVVTYDEFGGQWDHVPPPGQGSSTPGPHDLSGPGTRIPALIVSPYLRGDFVVDSVSHDTTSILATIEHRFGLGPLGARDAAVADLSSVYLATSPFDR